MLFSRERLMEVLGNDDVFDVSIVFGEPPNTFDLPDVRTGAIYPPIPHIKEKYTETKIKKVSIEL